jgi:hypothetical protein
MWWVRVVRLHRLMGVLGCGLVKIITVIPLGPLTAFPLLSEWGLLVWRPVLSLRRFLVSFLTLFTTVTVFMMVYILMMRCCMLTVISNNNLIVFFSSLAAAKCPFGDELDHTPIFHCLVLGIVRSVAETLNSSNVLCMVYAIRTLSST